jgi:hypothetical protein
VAEVGDTIVYTLSVANDTVHGDGSPIQDLSLTDDLVGTITLIGGDDGDGWLEVGESWVYTASYTIQTTDPDPVINTAFVSGIDLDGEEVPESSDKHVVVTGDRLYLFMPLVLRDDR